MTALFDAQVWYTDGDDTETVRGEGEEEFVGSLAHIFRRLQAEEHHIRIVDIRRMSK
jgi:hypothetical protein